MTKKPISFIQGNVIELHEDVYVVSMSRQTSFAGKRSSLLQVKGDSESGHVLVEVLSSKGYNAYPAGFMLKQPIAHLENGNDFTEPVQEYFKEGGIAHTSGKIGGYLVGRKHTEGGIKGINKSTGQPLEVEGGEVIITAPAVEDNTKREFEGQQLTNREILSKINVSGGGVSFADGGQISSCKCSGKAFKYGGQTMTDYQIVESINRN